MTGHLSYLLLFSEYGTLLGGLGLLCLNFSVAVHLLSLRQGEYMTLMLPFLSLCMLDSKLLSWSISKHGSSSRRHTLPQILWCLISSKLDMLFMSDSTRPGI